MDFELAGELKIGQVGIANLRIRTLDVAKLVEEMRGRVQRAPKLFARAAIVIDFGGLTRTPDEATARALIEGLREAGVLPVALAYGTTEIDRLGRSAGPAAAGEVPRVVRARRIRADAGASPGAPRIRTRAQAGGEKRGCARHELHRQPQHRA